MIEFTAYITCYNEESRIKATLKSLKKFKNVIVIDKSSTDATVDIVNRYNRKLYVVDYFDGSYQDPIGMKIYQRMWNECPTEWMFEVTCSDVYHPDLYEEMLSIINNKPELEAVYIPIYRYSMGYVSKYSIYGTLGYQPKLFKKTSFDWSQTYLHGNFLSKAKNIYYLKPKNKKIAIYHLTHETLETVIERHLRYAKIEANTDALEMSRDEYLRKSWKRVLGVIFRYIKLRTFKLKEDGKAQFCMWMLYRSANYLNLYFSKQKEKEIKEKYDQIRKGEFE